MKGIFATLEDGLVKNAHTNKKNLLSQILLGDKKLPITELDNNPPHLKKNYFKCSYFGLFTCTTGG